MAKHDWPALQDTFLIEHEQTGIGPAAWCEANGLKYSSARRYIKTSAKAVAKAQAKSSPKSKAVVRSKTTAVKNGAPFGAQNAVRHGGYSKYFKSDIGDLVEATTLTDELELCRSRIHLVIRTIENIYDKLDSDDIEPDIAASLYESLFKADNALDRNVGRVESIVKTLSSIQLDHLTRHKIVADTDRIIKTAKATVINGRKSEVQTELAQLQVQITRKQLGGTSKLDAYINELTGGGVDVVVAT